MAQSLESASRASTTRRIDLRYVAAKWVTNLGIHERIQCFDFVRKHQISQRARHKSRNGTVMGGRQVLWLVIIITKLFKSIQAL